MKWFKHLSDARFNLKLRQVISRFGMKGYGLYWACLEMVSQEHKNYCVQASKEWLSALSLDTHLPTAELTEILNFFADVDLIDKKALKNGDLFIPKLKDRSDEYTEKVNREMESRWSREIVGSLNKKENKKQNKNKKEKEKQNKKESIIKNELSPGEEAVLFFGDEKFKEKTMGWFLNKGISGDFMYHEIPKFVSYWTELSRSGKKQRWELEKTFEIKRRLNTWFLRASQYQSGKGQKKYSAIAI